MRRLELAASDFNKRLREGRVKGAQPSGDSPLSWVGEVVRGVTKRIFSPIAFERIGAGAKSRRAAHLSVRH